MLSAVYDSLVVFFVPVFVMEGKPIFENGQMHGQWVLSLTSFWCLTLVTNLRLSMPSSIDPTRPIHTHLHLRTYVVLVHILIARQNGASMSPRVHSGSRS